MSVPSDWDYERDLELLREKISQASGKGKEELRELILRAVNGNESQGQGEPAYGNGVQAQASGDATNISLSMVVQTGCLLSQFQKYVRERQPRFNTLDDDQSGTMTRSAQSEANTPEQMTWEDLEKVWSNFEVFFKTFLENPSEFNPFEIDLIIDGVLEYLPRQDLLNCRLINKLWNNNATRLFQWNKNYVCSVGDIKKFCDESAGPLPLSIFKKIKVKLETTSVEDCKNFFKNVGRHVKEMMIEERNPTGLGAEELKLKCSIFEYQIKLRTVFRNVPELEFLGLSYLPDSVLSQPFVYSSSEFKTKILRNVTALVLIISEDQKSISAEFIDGLYSMVPNISKFYSNGHKEIHHDLLLGQTSKLNLHTLWYDDIPISAKFLHKVMKHQKLKELLAQIHLQDTEDVEACQAFLNSQKDSIEELSLPVNNPTGAKLQLPVMNKLGTLYLGYGQASDILSFESKYIPNVRKIQVLRLSNFESFPKKNVYHRVQNLQFESRYGTEDCDTMLLTEIEILFPNLKKLKILTIRMNEDELAIVFNLSKLEDLSLKIYEQTLVKNINNTLSGLPTENNWIYSELISANSALIQSLKRTQPSLQNLKKLKKLRLEFESNIDTSPNQQNSCTLDDLGIHFGFLSLPRLHQLKLLGNFTVPEAGIAALKNYHYSVVIDPSARN